MVGMSVVHMLTLCNGDVIGAVTVTLDASTLKRAATAVMNAGPALDPAKAENASKTFCTELGNRGVSNML